MILTFDDLAIKFNNFTDVKGKIRREIQAGNLVYVARGLYETDRNTDGKYLAGYIYGPSYLSFDYILSAYSLIPETVYRTFTSATFRKGKTKRHENVFGCFTYRDVPAAVYSAGVNIINENGYSYQAATPEKALCDKLYSLPPVKNANGLRILLFDDLRIDEVSFPQLNFNDIKALAPLYRSKNLDLLVKLIDGVM